jgi:hypothetical protein
MVMPTLRALVIDDLITSLRHGGILNIMGFPADRAFRLGPRDRVPVEVSVTSGDAEAVGLYRTFCPPRRRTEGYDCFRFSIVMLDGYHARDLADRVAALGGRFILVSATGWLGVVTLFDPHDLVRRARSARAWPGVKFTALGYWFCPLDMPDCLSDSDLELPVPVDSGAAVPGDGIVQVRSGDTVTVRYRQPGGGTIEARRAVR